MGPQEAHPLHDPRDLRVSLLMWFLIDMADGSESLWFYWPMLGTGIGVAVTAVVLFGVGGVFGVTWERRQIERYLQQRGHTHDEPR